MAWPGSSGSVPIELVMLVVPARGASMYMYMYIYIYLYMYTCIQRGVCTHMYYCPISASEIIVNSEFVAIVKM